MANKAVLRTSKRTFRKVKSGFSGKKRYKNVAEIKKLSDLRTFFYEYSLFVGDYNSIPGLPSFSFMNSSRSAFLKAGRIVGDARAITNTAARIFGDAQNDSTKLGERYFRRVGGRVTGKALMAIPGNNVVSRAARSVVGANMQKEFDGLVKKMTGKSKTPKPTVGVQGVVKHDFMHGRKPQQIVEAAAEDIARNTHTYTPVKTGALRGSIKTFYKPLKVKGGYIQRAQVTIGGGSVDYAGRVEYGAGELFRIGEPAAVAKLFPPPASMRALRSSGNPRKAVTDQGKGAMLRRGAVKTKESFRSAGVRSKRMKDWSQIIREVTSI
tara:strand:- start:1307 stop:2278 length:972 start_codon:yes stop_codon:yes gene_type:complete